MNKENLKNERQQLYNTIVGVSIYARCDGNLNHKHCIDICKNLTKYYSVSNELRKQGEVLPPSNKDLNVYTLQMLLKQLCHYVCYSINEKESKAALTQIFEWYSYNIDHTIISLIIHNLLYQLLIDS